MSVRTLFPNLLNAHPSTILTKPTTLRSLFPRRSAFHTAPIPRRSPKPSFAVSLSRPAPSSSRSHVHLYTLGLGLTFLSFSSLRQPVKCDSIYSPVTTRQPSTGAAGSQGERGGDAAAPPESILNLYQLGFGTVAGICTGVFVKKGLRAIAFALGGMFVLLQYLSSRSFVTVDWKRLSGSYDNTFGTKTSDGYKAPTVGGVYNWFVDFVTANFQQRASFIAGLVLGFRLG